MRAQLERPTGRPLDEVSSPSIDPEPIGQASLAVVHRARLLDGREVAVKVLRPGIEGRIAADLASCAAPRRSLAGAVAGGRRRAFGGLIDGLRDQLQEELDLRNEARTMAYFRRAARARPSCPLVVVPETYDDCRAAGCS